MPDWQVTRARAARPRARREPDVRYRSCSSGEAHFGFGQSRWTAPGVGVTRWLSAAAALPTPSTMCRNALDAFGDQLAGRRGKALASRCHESKPMTPAKWLHPVACFHKPLAYSDKHRSLQCV